MTSSDSDQTFLWKTNIFWHQCKKKKKCPMRLEVSFWPRVWRQIDDECICIYVFLRGRSECQCDLLVSALCVYTHVQIFSLSCVISSTLPIFPSALNFACHVHRSVGSVCFLPLLWQLLSWSLYRASTKRLFQLHTYNCQRLNLNFDFGIKLNINTLRLQLFLKSKDLLYLCSCWYKHISL